MKYLNEWGPKLYCLLVLFKNQADVLKNWDWERERGRSRESEEKLLLNRAILKGIHQVRLFCVLLKGPCDYPSLSWADQEILKGYRDGIRVLLESSCFGCISRYFRVSISFLNWSWKEEIVFLSEELPFDRDVLGIKNTDFKSIASKQNWKII